MNSIGSDRKSLSFVHIHRKKNTQLNSRKDLQCSTEKISATIQQFLQWHISSSISIRSVWSLSTGFVSGEKEKVNEFQVLTRESIQSSREKINSSSAKHRVMSEESSSMRKQMIFKNLLKDWRSNELRLNWEAIFIFNRIEMKISSHFTSRRLKRNWANHCDEEHSSVILCLVQRKFAIR